ncbi:MAG TPA: hypothetical protein HA227_02300, partial [Candidatus Diapherotrites archaeon]|nr:hypothetical protein [Candidatus Diapherotrites archaeon]
MKFLLFDAQDITKINEICKDFFEISIERSFFPKKIKRFDFKFRPELPSFKTIYSEGKLNLYDMITFLFISKEAVYHLEIMCLEKKSIAKLTEKYNKYYKQLLINDKDNGYCLLMNLITLSNMNEGNCSITYP